MPPEADFRGRVLANHRQMLPLGWQLTSETGIISDRNFLEQYYEKEWDTLKDQTSGIELKKLYENMSFNLSADTRTNDFFMLLKHTPPMVTSPEWHPIIFATPSGGIRRLRF